jgi:acyl carrier protein
MSKLKEDQKEKIVEIMSKFSDVPIEGIKPETQLKDGLGFDSLDIVEMMMKFEEEFDINIPDEDYAEVKTVKDVFDVVENRLA